MFVIALQVSAMMSTGTLSRLAFLQSKFVLAHAPGADSPVLVAGARGAGRLAGSVVLSGEPAFCCSPS
jgi:hypothetical protein